MDVCVNKNEKTIEWNVGEKKNYYSKQTCIICF